MGSHTKQSNPHTALVAQSNGPCNRTDHKRPLIRAPRNHDCIVAPTGYAGFRLVTYNRAIVTERSGSPKCLVTFVRNRLGAVRSRRALRAGAKAWRLGN